MDAEEKLTALKKAYADIILNTEKEAAARIMVSERKARRLEYDLKTAKEDALHMLMRLKHMMDSKIQEAEMASFTQKKKIEELEAQLQEAEDIVKDLRQEMTAVQAELERVLAGKEVKHTVQVNDASDENIIATPESIVFPHPEPHNIIPPSDIENITKNPSIKGRRSYSSLFPFKKSYVGTPDLPAIILRSKEPEMYRNGCTQRIRACERTPLDEGCEKLLKAPSLGVDMEEKEAARGDSNCKGKSRKRGSSYRKKETLYQSQPLDKVKGMDQTGDNSCLTSLCLVKHSNDMVIDDKSNEGVHTNTDKDLVIAHDIPSTIREEKAELPEKLEGQVDSNSESKASKSCVAPIQVLNNRVIKYTFQRKRKRGALSTEIGNMKGKEVETQNVEKVNSVEETPEKKQLEQVARQLISLSETKWWQ